MPNSRYPWATCLFTCLCIAAYVGLHLDAGMHLFSAASAADGFPVIPIGVVLGAVVGSVILARQPHNRIGWLLSLGAAGGGVGYVTSAYAYRVLVDHEGGSASAGHLAAWISQFFGGSYGLTLMCAALLLVPDGRLLSRRWRPVMALLGASYLLWAGVLVVGVRPRQVQPDGSIRRDALVGDLLDLSTLVLVLAIVAAGVAVVLRLRRSTGVERQQMRWIMASGALLTAGLAVLLGYQLAGGPGEPWYVDLPLFLGYTSLPVSIGIAILRYRLYDIDVIINRAVVLGLLTAFVTVGYVATVVAIAATLGNRVLVPSWPSLVALVLVALAFQPLRQHVQRLADRLVYGRRAAPYEALGEFSRRLGHSPAPAELLPALAEAVARSVGAGHARVALDLPTTAGAPDIAGPAAAWPDAVERVPDAEFEVRDGDDTLGRIAVSMPAGRGLRRAERQLLERFAAQAALAFRNLRLDAELRTRVEHLGRQSAALAASRRRLVAARDGERRRIAGVIEREVLSHLRSIPAAVESLDAGDATAADQGLQRLETATGAALDALREVTQGLFPVALTRQGLVAALWSHHERRRHTGALTVAPALADRRFDAHTEAAAYFCGVALMEKSDAVNLSIVDGCLVLETTGAVADDQAIVDRVEAVGGHVRGGRVELPVSADQGADTDAQMAASRSVPNADLAT